MLEHSKYSGSLSFIDNVQDTVVSRSSLSNIPRGISFQSTYMQMPLRCSFLTPQMLQLPYHTIQEAPLSTSRIPVSSDKTLSSSILLAPATPGLSTFLLYIQALARLRVILSPSAKLLLPTRIHNPQEQLPHPT